MRGVRTRSWAAGIAVTLLVAGCAGAGGVGGDADGHPPDAATAAVPAAPGDGDVRVAGATEPITPQPTEGAARTAEPAPAAPVPSTEPPLPRVSVDLAIGPTTTVVASEAVPVAAPVDVFGDFASCSGLRESVANWSLQVSDPDETVTAVSILTRGPVTGPGDYDGTFRVEFVNGAALDGFGTVTLDPGLQSGTFLAVDADLRGSFTCTGMPAPVAIEQADVEVVALMRRGSSERMVSLAEPYSAETSCTAPSGRVQVAGDAGVGAPVELLIDGGALQIRIGGAEVAIDPAHTELRIDGGVGSFHAVTLDGLEIDGAFACAEPPATVPGGVAPE